MLNNNRVCKFLTKNPLKMEHDLQMHNIYRIQYAKMHCNSIVFTRLKVLQKRPKIREKLPKICLSENISSEIHSSEVFDVTVTTTYRKDPRSNAYLCHNNVLNVIRNASIQNQDKSENKNNNCKLWLAKQ